ncbi:hypothetical protein V1505DRAFT_332078 [Lipomyces doorenjongii]
MSLDEQPSSASLQQRIEALEAENRQTIEALDKKNKEIATLNEEFEGLQARYLDCRKNAVNLENKLQQAEAAKLSAKFREQNLTQEIELLKTNSKWLENELSTKTTEFSNFRKEKSAQVSSLQSELDSALADVSSFTKTKDTLTDRVSTLSKSLEAALQKVKTLQDSSATSEENFKKEMAAQQRLAALWERSTTEARARISELEEALDAERGKEAQQAASWQAIAEKERDRADEAETKLASLETELEDLHAAQERLEEQQEQQRTPGTPSTPHGNGNGSLRDRSPIAMFSPSAHAITQVQKSGISLTQLYTDFMKAKHQLEHERRRNKSLQQNFDELIQDLETRAPIIQADREEASRLKVEIADMSVLLDETEKDKEDLEKQLKTSTVIVNDAEREVKIYRQQVHDLSRQVQQLLVELQSQISGAGPLSAADQAALRRMIADTSSTELQSDTEALISERLVTFKNSIELQQQNQNLLRVTRELGDRLEREEAETRRKMGDLEAAAIREKQAKIEELEAEVKRTQTKMDSYQRERDMFRDMLSGKDGKHTLSVTAPLPPTAEPESESISADEYHETVKKHEEATKHLKELQEQFDAYRRETGVDMKMLNQQILRLSDERASAQQELSRAQSQIELTTERLKIMTDNFEMTKKENADVLKRSADIQEILTKQDLKTQQVANEIVEVKATLETMRNENANLKAEKSLFNSIQHRMTQESESLTEEKSRLNNVISYLQSLEAEREKSDAETRRRLVSQVENLQTELNATKTKLDAETEEVRKVTMRKEYESKEFQDKIDKILEELSFTKESVVTAKASQGQLQRKVDELTASLTAAEEKVTLYQRQIEEEGFSVARNLETEVGELKATLEATRTELDEAKEHAENLSGIASAAEEALGTMNATHDEYKSSVEEQLRNRDAEIGQLRVQATILAKEVAETNSELSKSQDLAVERDRQFSEAKAKLDGEIRHLSDAETRLLSNVRFLQSDLRKQAQITHESQKNYEAELVKHAATAQELQKLRNSHKMTIDLVHQLRNDADIAKNTLDNGEASWDLRRAGYEEEIENLKSRCDDLLEQNKLLHNQFASISSQVNRVQKRHQVATSVSATVSESADATEGTETTEATPAPALSAGDSVDEMREIVKFLRHEKEIVDCQYELALQETKRLKQRLDHATASLDEVREQLAQERENDSSTREQNLLHQELLGKVNELNILRESNSSLREENRRANNRIRNLEDDIKKLETQIQPLEDKLATANADLEAKEQQLKLVQEDNERWKNRAQQILQKYERVDPVELQNLKDEVAALKAEVDTISHERDAARSEVDYAKRQILTEKEEALKAKDEELQKVKAEAESVTTEIGKVKEELNAAISKSAEQAAEIEDKTSRIERLRTEFITKLKTRRDETKAVQNELETLKQEHEALKGAVTTKEMELQESKKLSDALQAQIRTLEAEISTLKETIDAKTKDIEVKDQAIEEFKTAAARAIPGPAEDGPVAAVPSTSAAWEEHQKRLEELQATLEKKQADLSEATKLNAARAAEAVKLKEELDRKQTELEQMKMAATESLNALPKSDATAAIGDASEELQNKLADLRTELESRHKSELEEALKAKIAEMEAQKAEAVNKAREISQKESMMRNKLLQQKAEKADKDKNEALRQLAMLRGETVPSAAVSPPLRRAPPAPQTPTASQGSPISQPSTPSHPATPADTPQPQSLGLQVAGASQSAQSAPPSGPRQLQLPQVSAPTQQPQGSQQASTSIPVRSIVKPVIGLQGQSRSQSQLPQLQRPGLQPLRGLGSQQAAGGPSPMTLSNPMQAQVLQHLQPGPRRSASQLVRPGVGLPVQGQAGAANMNRPSHIPHPPPAGGGIKIAGTAASTPPPEPLPESTAGIKRSREDDAAATSGGDATGSAGDSQTAASEMATGPPVALKRRREETQ